ncbi:MAG TPA: cation:proton antiporter [Burkholderiales bacterium]|jgi:CPA2 family monovalent cation:H+ antiporter-2|nr:cation:proton antiporter [Burkholderiales bacterium]
MPHEAELITTIAASLGLAMLMGYIAARMKMPPMAGYLLAGIIIGPATPGFVVNVALAGQLAEFGVMLLMFGVGLHFSIDDLLAVRRIAVPGAILAMCASTGLGIGLALLWGWAPGAAIVFGLALSVASTVVVLRALDAGGALQSINGRIAVGWLIVEDLVMVLVLVLLPPLAGMLGGEQTASGSIWAALALTLGKVVAFVATMLLVGRRVLPRLLWLVARTGSRELFTLCVISAAVGVAYVSSYLFDVSFALGAFFAGMMMRESELSHRAAEESLPLRDAFAVLFFVSVGVLFDPMVLLEHPAKLVAVVAIVMLANPLVAAGLVLAFRYPLNTAMTVGASLSQIGEFSFILAALGVALGLLPTHGQSLIVAAALISIAANPLVFAGLRPAHAWIRARSSLARRLERRGDPLATLPMDTGEHYLSGQVVLVGYGRVGRRIAQALSAQGVPYVVAEQNRERVRELREKDIAAVSGDAADPAVLIQAHIARASMLVIATPDTVSVRRMAEVARTLNPAIEIALRTHSEEEARLLSKDNVGMVFFGEHELASAMTRHVLARRGIATP